MPITTIQQSPIPLRLQDIAKATGLDRRKCLRLIEKRIKEERQSFAIEFKGLELDYDLIPYPNYIHTLRVRKGIPYEILGDLKTIRKKWLVHGNSALHAPRSYERLFMTYAIKREIMEIRKVMTVDPQRHYPAYRGNL